MKRILAIMVAVVVTVCVIGQVPQKMSYQAVIRNSSGVLVANQTIGMRISILQGSPTGSIVWMETCIPNPQTNANGLVSIEIGASNPLSIDWSAGGPYFLKTETDPTGGTNYTISGISQLLTVPYALYSKKAGTADYNSLTNLPNLSVYLTSETDPVFGASPAYSISATNIANWNTSYGWGNHAGLYRPLTYVPTWTEVTGKPSFALVATSGNYNDLSEKPITDGSETKLTAGTNVTVSGTGTTANPYVIGTTGNYLGQEKDGGIIFYLYRGSDEQEHGLIVAKTESSGASFGPNNLITYSNRTWDGVYNTSLMSNSTAKTYVQSLGDGWYLPSLDELITLWNNRLWVNKGLYNSGSNNFLTLTSYWSSTELNAWGAWSFNFIDGTSSAVDKTLVKFVRAIRAF